MNMYNTHNEYELISVLPDEIIYEIILMTREPYSDERKKLMSSIRREGIAKIVHGAGIAYPRSAILIKTDGTISQLINEVDYYELGKDPKVFNIPFGPMIKLRHFFNTVLTNNGYNM